MPDRLTGRTLVIATGHALSVALMQGRAVLASHHESVERGHAEILMPAIVDLLEPFGGPDAGCDQIVVEVGPGSFTGLRIGLAAAQALALAWDARLIGVRSTQLVAAAARAAGEIRELFVALAAPRGQIWAEVFAAGALESTGPPIALAVADAARSVPDGAALAGSGAGLIGTISGYAPSATAIVTLADSDFVGAELLYVRAGEMDASL